MGEMFTEDMKDILGANLIGLWYVEMEEGKPPRFFADDKMDELLGIYRDITPEERFIFHRGHIALADAELFEEYSNRLVSSNMTEISYRYIHPKYGEMYVRCGGRRDSSAKDMIRIHGTHQNISDLVRLEKNRVAERRLIEKNIELSSSLLELKNRNLHLEEQLDIINSLAQTHNVIYYINLKNNSFVEIGSQLHGIRAVIGTGGNAQESFDRMCSQLIVSEHKEIMREFTDLKTIDCRLSDRLWVSQEFKGTLAGWSEAFFIAARRDTDENCEYVLFATRSIDERKSIELEYQNDLAVANQKAQVANEAKSRFFFNMSHDIRTPMNAIVGFTDLLEKNIGNEEKTREYLGKLRHSSDFLLSLINNVLEVARIESGKITLDESVYRIGDTTNDIITIFSERMKKKGIEFNTSLNTTTKYVLADAIKVKEIFLNLMSNAYKYTPAGGMVTLAIEEISAKKPGYAHFVIKISDTGIGMSQDFLPQLFEDFSREKTVTEDGIEGTGLGMPIVKRLIELMGGTIDVESKLGEGTTFTINLGFRISEESSEESSLNEKYDESKFVGKRLLLAEDNDINAEIAMEILGDAGFLIDRAEDGIICVDMLQKAENNYYDLILMDIQMPHMDGYKATQIIRDMEEPDKSNIPIIAMTANAFEEDKQDALAVGMNDHIAKPINIKELFATLSRQLK